MGGERKGNKERNGHSIMLCSSTWSKISPGDMQFVFAAVPLGDSCCTWNFPVFGLKWNLSPRVLCLLWKKVILLAFSYSATVTVSTINDGLQSCNILSWPSLIWGILPRRIRSWTCVCCANNSEIVCGELSITLFPLTCLKKFSDYWHD